jgi:hypothetical protein
MEEEFGTLRIYMYLEVPGLYSDDKTRRVRRTLHTQHGVNRLKATDIYQSFMRYNCRKFRDEDTIFCLWQADPSFINLS